MSAAIHARVLARRAAVAQARAEDERRAEFLAEAKGEKGDRGPQGEAGPAPDHEWQGTKLRFRKPSGKWGKFTDLKGEPGKEGGQVIISRGGSSFNPATFGELPGGVLPLDFVIVERNGEAYRVPVSSLAGGAEVATYSKRADFISDSVFYRGEAAPGASESASVWRIARVTIGADGDVTELWAGGSSEFDKAWEDRASLSYS